MALNVLETKVIAVSTDDIHWIEVETKNFLYKINSCMDCPYHEVVADPDLDDSFNMDDEAVQCKLSDKQPTLTENGINYQCKEPMATVACRPYQLVRETTPIPIWCPLMKKINNSQ